MSVDTGIKTKNAWFHQAGGAETSRNGKKSGNTDFSDTWKSVLNESLAGSQTADNRMADNRLSDTRKREWVNDRTARESRQTADRDRQTADRKRDSRDSRSRGLAADSGKISESAAAAAAVEVVAPEDNFQPEVAADVEAGGREAIQDLPAVEEPGGEGAILVPEAMQAAASMDTLMGAGSIFDAAGAVQSTESPDIISTAEVNLTLEEMAAGTAQMATGDGGFRVLAEDGKAAGAERKELRPEDLAGGSGKDQGISELYRNLNAESVSKQESSGTASGGEGEKETFSEMVKYQAEQLRAMTHDDGKRTAFEEAKGPETDNRILEELKRQTKGQEAGFMNRLAIGTGRSAMGIDGAKAGALEEGTGEPIGVPVAEQLKAGLENGLKRELQEFTIKLKPEGLGEIVIHLTSAGERTGVRIGASSPETEKLINSQMMNLKEMLEPLHAEVEEVYHNSQGGMEFAGFGQEMYQQRESSAEQSRHFDGNRRTESDEDLLTEEVVPAEGQTGRLFTYV